MTSLSNTLVLITGAGSGIGAALAREAASRGARVALADIQFQAATAVAQEIAMAGGTCRAYSVDVTDAASLHALAITVSRDLGDPHILFANAGVIAAGTLGETTIADFAWMFDVNVTGAFLSIQTFLPSLLAHAARGEPAHIITTGSEHSLGLPPLGACSAYTATKHAVLGLSEALRRDLHESNVKVSVLCPGMVATNIANARRTRPAHRGGPVVLPAEQADMIEKIMQQHAQDPAITSRLACEGIERNEFLIIADPNIRELAVRRQVEVEAALALTEQRLEPLISRR